MPNLRMERFKRLPLHPNDTWQGGVFAMPAWIEDPDGKPYRPQMAVWVSTERGVVSKPCHMQPGDDPLRAALDALLEFGLSGEGAGRPATDGQ